MTCVGRIIEITPFGNNVPAQESSCSSSCASLSPSVTASSSWSPPPSRSLSPLSWSPTNSFPLQADNTQKNQAESGIHVLYMVSKSSY